MERNQNGRLAFICCLGCLCIFAIVGIILGGVALGQIDSLKNALSSTTTTFVTTTSTAPTTAPLTVRALNAKEAASLRSQVKAQLLKNAAEAAQRENLVKGARTEEKRDTQNVLLANKQLDTKKVFPAKQVTSLQDRLRKQKQ